MYNTLIENPRKIEFRVWEIEDRKMFYLPSPMYRAEAYEKFLITLDGKIFYYDKKNRLESELFIVQQFTGLLDKEKNKIFEGDIVRFGKNNKFPIDRSARILEGIVEWEPAGAMFVVVVYNKEEDNVVEEIHELRQADKIYTVVGNVFEGIKI